MTRLDTASLIALLALSSTVMTMPGASPAEAAVVSRGEAVEAAVAPREEAVDAAAAAADNKKKGKGNGRGNGRGNGWGNGWNGYGYGYNNNGYPYGYGYKNSQGQIYQKCNFELKVSAPSDLTIDGKYIRDDNIAVDSNRVYSAFASFGTTYTITDGGLVRPIANPAEPVNIFAQYTGVRADAISHLIAETAVSATNGTVANRCWIDKSFEFQCTDYNLAVGSFWKSNGTFTGGTGNFGPYLLISADRPRDASGFEFKLYAVPTNCTVSSSSPYY